MWDLSGLSVLIPKRRGTGYLRYPLGHHRVEKLADIEYDEGIDLCGIDGYLQLEYGYRKPDERREIEARVMPKLAAHFGFTSWHEDCALFWKILQPNA
jgi:hypothetical protein